MAPRSCRAWMKAANLGNIPGLATKRFTASLKEVFGPTLLGSVFRRSPKKLVNGFGGLLAPRIVLFPSTRKLNPSSFTVFRSTSATRTCSITCSTRSTARRLTTFLVYAFALSTSRCCAVSELTEPVRIIVSGVPDISNFSPGTIFSRPLRTPLSTHTLTSTEVGTPASVQ